jgi:hypothetical protein
MTRNDIAAVMAKIPGLTDYGLGTYNGGKGLSQEERQAEFRKKREALLNRAEICTKVFDWLINQQETEPIKGWFSSGTYKHWVERDIKEYVSNGAFIAAAVHWGLPYKLKPGEHHVYFKMA